jgi:hypothetical protein
MEWLKGETYEHKPSMLRLGDVGEELVKKRRSGLVSLK